MSKLTASIEADCEYLSSPCEYCNVFIPRRNLADVEIVKEFDLCGGVSLIGIA